MDHFFEKAHRRKIDELNVVPILDMLMSVIFFLLLSTTLVGYTKLEIPPAKVSQESDSKAIPISPKLFVTQKDGYYYFKLQWKGSNPSAIQDKLEKTEFKKESTLESKIRDISLKMISQFLVLYPEEQTLQVGLAEDIDYQILISVMDGVKSKVKDVVLFSYSDVKLLDKN